MKKVPVYFIFSLFIIILSGFLIGPQEKDFDKKWEQVSKYQKEGLPKSAIKIVDEIYQQAKAEGNEPQVLKSLIYRASLKSQFEEDHILSTIQQFETELKSTKSPEKEIVHSLLAELYQWYFNNNRWKILDRGVVSDYENEDVKTWDVQKLNQVIHDHFMASIQEQALLENIKLISFSSILSNTEETSLLLWPSLYDLLANRALQYFSSSDALMPEIYGASLNNPKLFSNTREFVLLDLKIDTTSKHFFSLRLYQHLLNLHLNQQNLEALIDLDLKRLQYVFDNSVQTEKRETAYIGALKYLAKEYSNNELSVRVNAQLAHQYMTLANRYNPFESEKYRYKLVTAKEICETSLEKFPNSKDANLCKNLIKEITQTKYSLKLNAAEIPGKPSLAYLSFTNTTKLFFKAIKINPENNLSDFFNGNREKMKGYLKKSEAYNWTQDLPDTKDHQSHSTEIIIPPMEMGYYLIFGSEDETFNDETKIVYQPVWITNLSFLSKSNNVNGSLEIFVLDRETGSAISGVEVIAYTSVYNQRQRESELKKVGDFFTDEKGFARIFSTDELNRNQVLFTLKKENDFLTSQGSASIYIHSGNTKLKTKTYFFTDRAIYRPGQTVYFKGIVVDKNGNEVQIKPDFDVEVSFYDANRKMIKTQDLVTNHFGSFHGAFVIPTGGLNGSMRIKNKTGSISFSVEEYKRPTFEVVMDTVREKFKLGDEITVNGKAENFAGSKLQSAELTYRVSQSPILISYFRYFPPYPSASEINIAHGSLFTNDDGSFSIKFKTEDSETQSRNNSIPQRFTIYASVIDITGEVQSATSYVTIGKNALILTIQSSEKIQKESNQGIEVSATNLSGALVKADVSLKVFKLTPSSTILVKRYWNMPDLVLIPEEEFREKFPNVAFKNESEKDKWARDEVRSVNTSFLGKSTLLKDFFTEAKPGEYLVQITSVSEAQDTTKAEKYITLFSSEGKKLPGKMLSWSVVSKDKAEPGETVQLLMGSSEKKSRIFYEIMNGNEIVESKWVNISRSQKVIDIPVLESYRGNFEIRTSLTRHNRSFVETHIIEVPFSNKKLDLTIETHRDFLTPGQKEEWRVKVSGPKGEKLAAEVLAGMYDASLDQFRSNSWNLDLYNTKRTNSYWSNGYFRVMNSTILLYRQQDFVSLKTILYPEINWFGYRYHGNGGPVLRMDAMAAGQAESKNYEESGLKRSEEKNILEAETEEAPVTHQEKEEKQAIPMRTNFNETAFFFPQLKTDSLGDVVFSFTTPDALTEWKFMMLAYSKDLKTGKLVEQFKAHKDLMIIPNLPRFLREGDKLTFSAKVVNFTDKSLQGNAEIEFYDALTMKTINIFSSGSEEAKTLNIGAGKSELLSWEINVPTGLSMVGYRIKASTTNFADGEERLIPVLTNRMLVTETLPLPVKGNQTKTFTFKKLVESGKHTEASTLTNHKLTLEFTSNPAWYAVQALPYLKAPKTESAGNLFRQYFANALSGYIINSDPKIKNVIKSWRQITPDAFYSNLQKNEELKNIVLSATPWVLDSDNEAEQKRRIAILFDVNRMANEKSNALTKLKQNQLPTGAWPWYKGMREDRHTTQSIVLGIAKLHDKGVINLLEEDDLRRMTKKAVTYLDKQMQKEFDKLKKNNPKYKTTNQLGSNQIEYLYARSILLDEMPIPQKTEEAFNYYSSQAKKYWLKKDNYLQAMVALTLYRLGNRNEAEGIMRSLKERALHSEEMGMYWRTERGWYWYQAPIETQAITIEAYAQILNDPKAVEQMKVWLLKQKQTTKWNTSTATAEAVYALLLTGDNLLADDRVVKIKVAEKQVNPKQIEGMKIEPGTGYFKTSWSGTQVKPDMGKIEVENPNKGIAWGAVYWQYFEDLDIITSHDSPLSVEKIFFIEELTDGGPVIKPLKNEQALKTGDKVIVRLVIKTDRDMDYVHLKDMRASALEPVNAISGYSYSGGLGFYKSVTDVSTEFFIRTLPKGTFVIEYPMAVTQKGDFSNGIASIQSYYAPEFAAHSQGTRIVVE